MIDQNDKILTNIMEKNTTLLWSRSGKTKTCKSYLKSSPNTTTLHTASILSRIFFTENKSFHKSSHNKNHK